MRSDFPKKASLRIAAGIVAQLIREELTRCRYLDQVGDNRAYPCPQDRARVFRELRVLMTNMRDRSGLPEELFRWKEALEKRIQPVSSEEPSDGS